MSTRLTFLHPRSAWVTTRPVSSDHPFTWDTIDFVVIHWPGHDGVPDGDIGDRTDVAAYIRNAHHNYLDDPKRGYSLGYGCMVDYLGGSWEVRGDDFRAASNAPAAFNARSFSINYLTDLDGNTTPQGLAEVNRIIAAVRRLRPAVKVVPHGDGPKYVPGATPTACPGRLAQLVHNGTIGGQTVPAPPLPPTPAPSSAVLMYRVVSGDSYWRIAERVHADGRATAARVAELQRVNGSKALRPGDVIMIPGRVAG